MTGSSTHRLAYPQTSTGANSHACSSPPCFGMAGTQVELGIKYDPSTGTYGMNFYVHLLRPGDSIVTLLGAPFNDAYRYVDWLLTVPLLLIELILLMKMTKKETVVLSWTLGLAAAATVGLGYAGETQVDLHVR